MSPDYQEPGVPPRSLSSYLISRLLRLRPNHGPRPTGQRVRDALEAPRWALTLALLLFALLFLAFLVLLLAHTRANAATSDGINFDRPTKDWYQGPVRYIISRQEVKAYKALETPAERATFIDWFWQRRDVDPKTPGNEFRSRFELRVLESTRKFSYTTMPGWKTDMGKIYVLVGPPDEIVNDIMAKTHRGIITWIYRKPPFPDLPANTVVAFARDVGGEFRLSTSPTLDSDVARGLKWSRVKLDADQRLVTAERDPVLLDAGVSLSQGKLETQMIYGRMQQLPPHEEELFKTFVATKETYGMAIPMESRFDFYRGADGATYTTVTVGIKSSSVQFRTRGQNEVPDVAVFGKLVNREHPDESYPLASDSAFAGSTTNNEAGAGDLLIFQAVGVFKPGVYQAILGVEDRVSRKVSSVTRVVSIPDMAQPALSLSSITLATMLEPTEYAPTTAKPFQLGKFRLAPQPDAVFSKTHELNVYFQVYNPATDSGTGQPKVDVQYTFRYKEADGTLKDIGTYQVKDSVAQVHGYSVALERWPEGQYTLTVTVLDQIAKATVSAETTFTIK
jgi:GWxTD domain-containing protein